MRDKKANIITDEDQFHKNFRENDFTKKLEKKSDDNDVIEVHAPRKNLGRKCKTGKIDENPNQIFDNLTFFSENDPQPSSDFEPGSQKLRDENNSTLLETEFKNSKKNYDKSTHFACNDCGQFYESYDSCGQHIYRDHPKRQVFNFTGKKIQLFCKHHAETKKKHPNFLFHVFFFFF